MLLKMWIVFVLGWLCGVVNALETVKEMGGAVTKPGRKTAQMVAGFVLIALATTIAVGIGAGLVWVVGQ